MSCIAFLCDINGLTMHLTCSEKSRVAEWGQPGIQGTYVALIRIVKETMHVRTSVLQV